MPTVYDIADAIAERLSDIDLTALALLEEQYQGILDRVTVEIEGLERDLAEAQGQPQRGQWLQRRLAALKDELHRILTQWADESSTIIELEQERALRNVRDETRNLIIGSLGDVPLGARLPSVLVPVEALNNLIGFLGDGSPIRSYFDTLADSVSERIIATYLDGLVRGFGPKQIGSQVRAITGEPLHRAQALARTATINAYREAQRRIFEKNANIVKKWRWSATLDARTCVICWSMHGTVHSTSERMATHWNCRCAMIPITATWRELGFDVDEPPHPEVDTGIARFARLSPAEQRAILGPGKLALYQQGKLQLMDVVGLHDDPIWGTMRHEIALKDL